MDKNVQIMMLSSEVRKIRVLQKNINNEQI